MKSVTKIVQALTVIAGLALASSAFADEQTEQATIAPAPKAEEVMSDADLGAYSGGTSSHDWTIVTNETLQAVNHDNTVSGDVVSSGNISLSQGALSGFDGIGNFIMNTGHNNNLQSSMSVSILLGAGS